MSCQRGQIDGVVCDLEVVGKLSKVMEYQFDGHYFQLGGQLQPNNDPYQSNLTGCSDVRIQKFTKRLILVMGKRKSMSFNCLFPTTYGIKDFHFEFSYFKKIIRNFLIQCI